MKSPSIKSLIRQADKLLQIKCVSENPKCLVCGQPTAECHHFIPKSQSNNLRYDEVNLIPLCKRCHYRHHLSGDPHITATILLKLGADWWDDLQIERRYEIKKLNKGYLKEVIERLR